MSNESTDADLFWEHAEPYLELPGVSRSTMMGLPCLRIEGKFFASFDHQTGDLLVKLDATRVDQLLAAGDAHAFAPAGRRFREWAAVSPIREPTWADPLHEAFDFVGPA